MTRTERSLKSSARDAIDFAISDSSRSLVWRSWDGSAWTSRDWDCSRVCDYERDGDDEKRRREEMTDGSEDVVIDSGHAIGALERDSAGCQKEILIFGGMTLEFYKERSMKGQNGIREVNLRGGVTK